MYVWIDVEIDFAAAVHLDEHGLTVAVDGDEDIVDAADASDVDAADAAGICTEMMPVKRMTY